MPYSISLLPQLLMNPRTVFSQMRQHPPILFSFLTAWAASALYCWLAPLLLISVQSNRLVLPGSLADLLQSGFGPQRALLWAVMIVLFIAAILVPIMLLVLALMKRGQQMFRQHYAAMVSSVLLSWAMASLLALVMAALAGWLSANRSGETLTIYALLLFLLPLPIFASFNAAAIRELFSADQKISALIALLSLIPLVALPVLLQSVTIQYASPILLLIVLILLLRNKPSVNKQN
jgi:hypothetical protein